MTQVLRNSALKSDATANTLHRIRHGLSAKSVLMVGLRGAGLPQQIGNVGKAKSYAEQPFSFPVIGPLWRDDSFEALQRPVREQGVEFSEKALGIIFNQTKGYPYFLQKWARHFWSDVALHTVIPHLPFHSSRNI